MHPQPSEITPRALVENRRQAVQHLLLGAGALTAPSWATGQTQAPGKLPPLAHKPSQVPGAQALDKPSAYQDATGYNNF